MIIIPDIHGRNFWQKIVRDNPTERILFLGDYVDPYPQEGLTTSDGIDQLEAVIKLKCERPKDVTLLLGNHDLTYIYPDYIMASRHDFALADETEKFFTENAELFHIAYAERIARKEHVFSHAGFHPLWVNANGKLFLKAASYSQLASIANQLFHSGDPRFIKALSNVSALRGGLSPAGSIVWADEHEFANAVLPKDVYQIFGHTQQDESPIITSRYACLDCRKAFRLNEQDGSLEAIQ